MMRLTADDVVDLILAKLAEAKTVLDEEEYGDVLWRCRECLKEMYPDPRPPLTQEQQELLSMWLAEKEKEDLSILEEERRALDPEYDRQMRWLEEEERRASDPEYDREMRRLETEATEMTPDDEET
jgi:hypothetical protein